MDHKGAMGWRLSELEMDRQCAGLEGAGLKQCSEKFVCDSVHTVVAYEVEKERIFQRQTGPVASSLNGEASLLVD